MNYRERLGKQKREQFGPTTQKILLLLAAGFTLSLTRRPDHYFRIIKSTQKEWHKINQRTMHDAIKKLYQSKIIQYSDDAQGNVSLILSDYGKNLALKYNLEKLKIKKFDRWDGLWRIVMFDVPENKKKGRDALSFKLKKLGLRPFQKSVFIYPYDCKNEINFIVEIFGLKPYVRFIVAKEIDTALDWKNRFGLI